MAFYNGGMRKPIGLVDKDYVASTDWKCPESPTGGHWWDCNTEPFVCKICGKVKTKPGPIVQTPPSE